MIALTGRQMQQVQQASVLLPVSARDSFLRSVAGRLSEIDTPSDSEVDHAVRFVLSCRGVACGRSGVRSLSE
jgi:hypothetical protein